MPLVIKTNPGVYDFSHNFGNCLLLLHGSVKQEDYVPLLQDKLTSKDFLKLQIFILFCTDSIRMERME